MLHLASELLNWLMMAVVAVFFIGGMYLIGTVKDRK